MSKQRNIDLSGNNSTQQPTAQPSEMGKYSTPELQAAFNTGREIGRTEGMLYYIKHASENMQKEAEKLSAKITNAKSESIEGVINCHRKKFF